MGSLFEYSGLTTKVRAMKGKLIKKEDFIKMSKMQSVDEIISFLRTLGNYDEFLEFEGQLHRGEFEKAILHSLIKDVKKIYKFANQKQRKFLNLYITKYEVLMLKKAVRGLNVEEQYSKYAFEEETYYKHSHLDMKKIYQVANMDELLQAVKNTVYYKELKRVATYNNVSKFDYEIALDLFFFKNIWDKRKRHFKGKELKIVTETFGTEVDSLNIMWIYRAIKYYNITPAKIYSMTIPAYYKLRKQQVLRLAGCADINEFCEELSKTYYRKFISEYEMMSKGVDHIYREEMRKISNKLYRNDPYSMAVINSYLRDKNEEMEKMIAILESVRYKQNSELIEKIIV